MSPRHQSQYRILIFILFVSLIVFGIAFILLTNSFLHTLVPSAQQYSDEPFLKKDLLLLGITMVAGLPAVGIGAYLAHVGNQFRIKSSSPQAEAGINGSGSILKWLPARMKGTLLILLGGLIIIGALILPIVVWWMTQTS